MPGSPDTQYIFDSSFELGYITGDVYDWLYNLDFNLDALVDYRDGQLTKKEFEKKLENSEVRELFYSNECHTADLQDVVTTCFDTAYERMSLEQKCFFDLGILFGSHDQPRSMQYQLAKRVTDCHFGNNWQTPIMKIKNENDLDKIDNVKFVLENDKVLSSWTNRMKTRIHQAQDNLQSVNRQTLRDHLIHIRDERDRKYREAQIAYYEAVNEISGGNIQIAGRQIESDYQDIRFGSLNAEAKKKARKSISKAMNLFGKLFNRKDIEGFIKGYEYIVEGEKFNYRLTKSNRTSILHHTLQPRSVHVPYDLEITTKNNIVLAQACYLFENTPIIDQIIAFTLMIKSGNENDFIQKANLFKITPEYNNSELPSLTRELKGFTPGFAGEVTLDDLMNAPMLLTTLENPTQELWMNRIAEGSGELFSSKLDITYDQWHHFLYPQTNIGGILDQPLLIENFTI